MAKLTKRTRAIREKIEAGRLYPVEEAFGLLKEISSVKFRESVEVCINLGVDARKSDQVVRGSTVLPKGTGKTVRVAVFAQAANADAAKEAGADIVGFEDLAEEIKGGKMDFDVVIATPDAMRVVGKLGQILGPRGLMPNVEAVNNAKAGQVRYRTDKGGIIHCIIGKVDFAPADLQLNLEALLRDLVKMKPSSAKGVYLEKITVSSTMGPGLTVEQGSLSS